MLQSAAVNYKELYRKVEKTLGRIERSQDLEKTLSLILKSLVDDYKDELGISGGRIYRRSGKSYRLTAQHGREARVAADFRIPLTYPPIQLLLRDGFICMGLEDSGFDRELEAKIGVKRFAAIAIGEDSPYLIAFTVRTEVDQ